MAFWSHWMAESLKDTGALALGSRHGKFFLEGRQFFLHATAIALCPVGGSVRQAYHGAELRILGRFSRISEADAHANRFI